MTDWVIIVDDDASDLHTAEKTLKENGFKVTALGSGRELLTYLQHHDAPDLILMGLLMREMNGFETLKKVRELEKDGQEIPVIFLSSDENQESEARSLRLGATDFIRKPFQPDALVSRVQHAVRTQEKIRQFEKDVITDQMTGLLNKSTAEERLNERCRTDKGYLCVLDLDSFKLINDLYGHDTGDRALVLFSGLLRRSLRSEDICGRIGGDEFVLFLRNMPNEEVLQKFCNRINQEFQKLMVQELGAPLKLPLGVSFGAAEVPAHGREYNRLFHLADQALLSVKSAGKHGCVVTSGPHTNLQDETGDMSLDTVTKILEERSVSANAMWMGREAFINIYRYMVRYMTRYHGSAYQVLFTLTMNGDPAEEEKKRINEEFRAMVQSSLRNSDVMVEVSENQVFLLLPEMKEENMHVVIDRLRGKWNKSDLPGKAKIAWETGRVQVEEDDAWPARE